MEASIEVARQDHYNQVFQRERVCAKISLPF